MDGIVTLRWPFTTVALYSAVVPGYTAKTGLPVGKSLALVGSFLFGKGIIALIGNLYFLRAAMTTEKNGEKKVKHPIEFNINQRERYC